MHPETQNGTDIIIMHLQLLMISFWQVHRKIREKFIPFQEKIAYYGFLIPFLRYYSR